MKKSLLGLSLLMLSYTALAADSGEVLKKAQASMLVTGQIDITPEGKIKSYAIDQQDKLPAPVLDLLQKISRPGRSVRSWSTARRWKRTRK